MAAADFVCDAIRAFEKSNGPEDSFERAGLEGGEDLVPVVSFRFGADSGSGNKFAKTVDYYFVVCSGTGVS